MLRQTSQQRYSNFYVLQTHTEHSGIAFVTSLVAKPTLRAIIDQCELQRHLQPLTV